MNSKSALIKTLVLDEEEVSWLKGIMQNPMFVDHPNKEDPRDRKYRAIFWKALGGDTIPSLGSIPSGASYGQKTDHMQLTLTQAQADKLLEVMNDHSDAGIGPGYKSDELNKLAAYIEREVINKSD